MPTSLVLGGLLRYSDEISSTHAAVVPFRLPVGLYELHASCLSEPNH